ncbi:sugar transferase, partial [Escherichia coli]|uniref:sugar transferase n=1 Tax=Escherichia coli TaxID=562 RepID=UPI000ABE247C
AILFVMRHCVRTWPHNRHPASQLIEGYMLRHKVKPGITGWAQINGWRGETDTLEKMEKRVEFDLEYIREWSVWFDIKIVFLTVFKGFVNKAAY